MQKDSIADASMFKPPSRLPVVLGVVGGLVVGAVSGGLIGAQAGKSGKGARGERPAASASSAAAAPSTSASAAPAGSAAPGSATGGLAARAASGEEAAKKEIEARPVGERTADEVTALAKARVEAKKKELGELARKITLVPKVAKADKEVAARLKELSSDREIATDTLRMFASLPSPIGPDLLYGVVAGAKKSDTTELAEALLYSKDVRPKASLELSALLDLRRAEQCEDVKKALADVTRNADRRAIVPLMRYENKRGCGEKKTDDCWKCLREGDLLKEAQKAVQKRPAP